MTHETSNALRFRIAKVRPAFGEVGHNYGLSPAENISVTVWAYPTRLTCNVYKEASLQAGMSTGVNGASNPWKVVACRLRFLAGYSLPPDLWLNWFIQACYKDPSHLERDISPHLVHGASRGMPIQPLQNCSRGGPHGVAAKAPPIPTFV